MLTLGAPALILDVVDLQERDRIVTFLTSEHGQRRGVARGSKTKYSRFAGQLQPLAKAQISWFEKDGADLVRISDVSLLRPAAKLQTDLEGILLGTYLAEHIKEFTMEFEPSDKLFRLLDSTLQALLDGADRMVAARYFEVWVLRLSGIFPVPRACPLCERPLRERAVLMESEAVVVCVDCGGESRWMLGPGEMDFLLRSARENLATMAATAVPTAVLQRIEELCAKVRRNFLQNELRSYLVMKQTLASLR